MTLDEDALPDLDSAALSVKAGSQHQTAKMNRARARRGSGLPERVGVTCTKKFP